MTQLLTPERLAEAKDLIRYESSIAFYSARARETVLLLITEAEEADRLRTLLAGREDDLRFLRETAIPELRRKWESEEDGKKRWRDRAETAEAGLAGTKQDTGRSEALAGAADLLAELGTPITGKRTDHDRGVMFASERVRALSEAEAGR